MIRSDVSQAMLKWKNRSCTIALTFSHMRWAFIKLHIAVLLAGFTAILGKLISLPEASLVWWRLLLAVLALLPLAGWWQRRSGYVVSAKSRLQLLGIGALVGLHWLCFFGSVKYGNVSIALVTFSAAGFFSALLEPVLRRTRIRLIELLLGALCVAGIYIIFHFDSRYKLGIALGVLSAALSALFSGLNKQMVTTGTSGLAMTLWEMIGALAVLSVLMPVYVWYRGDGWWPVGYDWWWLLLLSLLCTVWAFFLQLQALQYISAVTLNLTYNLEPVYGILLAFVFFQENKQLTSSFFIGLAIIGLSVAVQTWRVYRGYR
jgi:drug/metabolite transporter (DMT)-like permease